MTPSLKQSIAIRRGLIETNPLAKRWLRILSGSSGETLQSHPHGGYLPVEGLGKGDPRQKVRALLDLRVSFSKPS